MIYLDSFYYPSYDEEYAFRLNKVKRTCYNTMYPFFTLSAHGMTELRFEPITVLYGGNGTIVVSDIERYYRDAKMNARMSIHHLTDIVANAL